MKHLLTKILTLTLCFICSLPAVAQLSEYNYLNGTYVKKGNGYTIEAKIDTNGWDAPENSFYQTDFDSEQIPVSKYYGYIKLTSEGHQEGYDIVEIIPSGDGPLFMLAGWQIPVGNGVAPSFYNNTLVMDSGMTMEEDYLHETLKKVVKKAPAKKTGKASRKGNRKAK